MLHVPWSQICRVEQREPAVGVHRRQFADFPQSSYIPHQFALVSSLAPGQAQATVFQQMVVPHVTQVL